jgi:ribosome biogenesis GTPase
VPACTPRRKERIVQGTESKGSARGGLAAIGWTPAWASAFSTLNPDLDPDRELVPARVVEAQKGALRVIWAGGELWAELSGRLRYTAAGPADLPGVGDWVAVAPRPAEGRATVHHLLPRRTALLRKAPERPAEAQLLVANVDSVLVVVSANRNFRRTRIERMLALVGQGGAEPILVLSKSDLARDLDALVREARAAAADAPVLAVSALTGDGVDGLLPHLGPGRSAALLGSSGVGKSTLLNRLLGEEVAATRAIRDDDKGRHTTTGRVLFPLPTGGVLVDTPGLREVGLWEDESGVDAAFPEVEALLDACRFNDCGHGNEPGCAVRAALEDGSLDPERWASYGKLKREVAHLETKRSSKARHEQRKKSKAFAKRVRNLPDKRRRRD